MNDDGNTIPQSLRAEIAPLRGLWHDIAADLWRMGVARLANLRGQKPEALSESYRALTGRPPDPILTQCFSALVSFAETGVATPWRYIVRAEARSRFA